MGVRVRCGPRKRKNSDETTRAGVAAGKSTSTVTGVRTMPAVREERDVRPKLSPAVDAGAKPLSEIETRARRQSTVQREKSREEEMAIDESDLAARLMEDMDARLLDFLRNQVNSFVKWDLVRFFHENPNTTDTAENLARYAGRDPSAIEKELHELAESKVLNRETLGEMTVYSLATDREMRGLIEQFVLACDDRQFRVKAIYHIIRGMR